MKNAQSLESFPNAAQLRRLLRHRELSTEQLEAVTSALIPTDIQEEHYRSSESGVIEVDLFCDEYEIYIPIDWDYKVTEAFLCLAYSYGPYGHQVAKDLHLLAGVCVDEEKMLFFFNTAKALALVVAEQKAQYHIEVFEEEAEDTSASAPWREEVQLQKILMQQKVMTSHFPQGDELIETMASLHVTRKAMN